jgi:hypothetical protein
LNYGAVYSNAKPLVANLRRGKIICRETAVYRAVCTVVLPAPLGRALGWLNGHPLPLDYGLVFLSSQSFLT